MALPRTKVVLAMAAAGLAAVARRPARRAGVVRRSVDAMVITILKGAVISWRTNKRGQLGAFDGRGVFNCRRRSGTGRELTNVWTLVELQMQSSDDVNKMELG